MQKPGFNIPAFDDNIGFEDYRLRTGDRIFVKVYSTDNNTNVLFNGSSNSMILPENRT